MANITYNDASLSELTAGNVAADDVMTVWDTSAGQLKKATRKSAVGAHITGDKNLAIPADGTAALLEVNNAFTVRQVIPAIASGSTGTVADDAAFSFTPVTVMGVIVLWNNAVSAAGGQRSALISFRAGATPHCVVMAQPGTAFEVNTIALTGTTGTDGKITVSAAADGKIYIENRAGGNASLGFQVFGIS